MPSPHGVFNEKKNPSDNFQERITSPAGSAEISGRRNGKQLQTPTENSTLQREEECERGNDAQLHAAEHRWTGKRANKFLLASKFIHARGREPALW